MSGIIKPFMSGPIKHLKKLVNDPAYRTWCWLVSQHGHRGRNEPFSTRAQDLMLHVPDAKSFLFSYKEIYCDQQYAFRSNSRTPFIIDLGASIGLSVLFFKNQYPNAEIIALEPDPEIFGYLAENLRNNGLLDVEIQNRAAWNSSRKVNFLSEGADAGRVINDTSSRAVEVDAVDIREIFTGDTVDLLKMDIEGAEEVVLPACAPLLSHVRSVIIEYHARFDKPQQLSTMISILEDAGFHYEIVAVWSSHQPLLNPKVSPDGYSYQANIYGYREQT